MRNGREILNKGILLLAFLAGSGGILYLKLAESPTPVIIGFPIVILFVYSLIALTVSDKLIYEIIGDNCYYLGFVFTLTSLAVTLYLLEAAPQGQLLRSTISGFGVALSSTIVGIVLRVLMQRMAPDIAQQEGEARADLDLAVRDFRTHLSMSIGELKRYSVETSQVLAEQRAALQEGIQRDAHTYREAVEEGIAGFRKALGDIAAALSEPEAETRDAVRRNIEEYRQILEGTMTDLRNVLDEAVRAFAEYRDEAGRLASLSRTTFEQTGESADAARNELERMKALSESIVALSSESRGLDAVLSGLVGRLATVEDGIAAKLEPAVARMSEGAAAVSAVLADSSGKLKSAAERFEAAAERTAAADMQTNIAGASERIADAAGRLESANAALATAIAQLGELADRTAQPGRTGILGGVFGTRGR